MGTQQQKAPQNKQISQFQIEVACLKVKGYVELNRDRRTNQALMKEKALNEMLRNPTRVMVEEYQKFQQLVLDVRFLETCNIVIRYCEVVKDQSIRIFKCGGDPSKIADIMPYIETIVFAADNLNLEQVMEFKDLMIFYFGPGFNDTNKLINVDQNLKKLYKTPLPDAYEVNEFALKFAEKYGFSEEQLNASGHQFSSKFQQPAQGGMLIDQQPFGQQQFMPPPNQGFGVLLILNKLICTFWISSRIIFTTRIQRIWGFWNGRFWQSPLRRFWQSTLRRFWQFILRRLWKSTLSRLWQFILRRLWQSTLRRLWQFILRRIWQSILRRIWQSTLGRFWQSIFKQLWNIRELWNLKLRWLWNNLRWQLSSINRIIQLTKQLIWQSTFWRVRQRLKWRIWLNKWIFKSIQLYQLNQGPQILASQSMKVPQTFQPPQSQQQPYITPPQQPLGQQKNNNDYANTQAIDDLEARLRKIDQGL